VDDRIYPFERGANRRSVAYVAAHVLNLGPGRPDGRRLDVEDPNLRAVIDTRVGEVRAQKSRAAGY
jgi:hypothetical protein